MSKVEISKIDVSNMNPGENGAPDQVTVRASISSSLHEITLSQSAGVIVLLEPGSIKKDFDGAQSEARKEAARIFGVVAQALGT